MMLEKSSIKLANVKPITDVYNNGKTIPEEKLFAS